MTDATRTGKPQYVKMSEGDWNALTPEQQTQTILNFQLQLQTQRSNGKKPTSAPRQGTVSTSAQLANDPVDEEPSTDLSELLGIRRWNENVGQYTAERIRNCIIYQLDVKKDLWWIARMTKGFIKAKIDKLNDDTPEDYIYEKNPLFGLKKVRTEDSEFLISTIEREPKNEAERKRIREKFGVTPQTIPYLAKKSCQKCKGTGLYEVSSYPGDPVYKRLTESVECDCSYE